MHVIPFSLLFSAALVFTGTVTADPAVLPQGFVYVDALIPNIKLDMSYCTEQNFVGKPINGYLKPRAILTRAATDALNAVQNELATFGLGLKIFDAYRPQRAVDHFVRWAADADDTLMKSKHYPHIDKAKLIGEGYILSHSGHSRGSTVDLTLVSLNRGEDLDMGGIFDFFSPESWAAAPTPTPPQRAHRMLLQVLMEQHGFVHYPKEWWHFTLKNEPYPGTYFDFPVQ